MEDMVKLNQLVHFFVFGVVLFGFPLSTQAAEVTAYGFTFGLSYSNLQGADANNMAAYFVAPDAWAASGEYWQFSQDQEASPSGAFGFTAGTYTTIGFLDWLLVRGELNYTWRGAEYSKKLSPQETYGDASRRDSLRLELASRGLDSSLSEDGTRRYNLLNAHLDVPLLLVIAPIENWHIFAGPQVSYALHNTFERHRSQAANTTDEPDINPSKSSEEAKLSLVDWDYGYMVGTSLILNDQVELGIRYKKGLTSIVENENNPEITYYQVDVLCSFNFSLW
jgi:hypothetical protein